MIYAFNDQGPSTFLSLSLVRTAGTGGRCGGGARGSGEMDLLCFRLIQPQSLEEIANQVAFGYFR